LEDSKQDIYAMRGINRKQGCLVVVRPDQYIAQVLPLGDTDALSAFFCSFMVENDD
jgi:phenol 2-monooxygenase/3-hydroxybenzoate 4-monooxygenase